MVDEEISANLIKQIRACFFPWHAQKRNKLRNDSLTYLDAEFVILHSRVDQEKQGLSKETLVLRVLKQSVIVRVHCDG